LEEKHIASSFYRFDGFSDANPFSDSDFAVTLGGDGTVLFAARGCASLGIPVFPVNLGEFGFIASIEKNEWKEKLELFLSGALFIGEGYVFVCNDNAHKVDVFSVPFKKLVNDGAVLVNVCRVFVAG